MQNNNVLFEGVGKMLRIGFEIVDDVFRHKCGFKCQQSNNIDASSKLKQSVLSVPSAID